MGGKAEDLERGLCGDWVGLDKQGCKERREFAVYIECFGVPAGEGVLAEASHARRRNVAGNADDADSADGEHGECERVVAAEHGDGWAASCGFAGEVEVGGRVFDRDDARVSGELFDAGQFETDAGSAWDVVEDDGDVGGVCDGGKVRDEAGLRGLVVIRVDAERGVGAEIGGETLQLARVVRAVRTRTNNREHVPLVCAGDGVAAERRVFIASECRRFAGGAGDDDTADLAGGLLIEQTIQRSKVDG